MASRNEFGSGRDLFCEMTEKLRKSSRYPTALIEFQNRIFTSTLLDVASNVINHSVSIPVSLVAKIHNPSKLISKLDPFPCYCRHLAFT
jgi:hypothetical protein